MLNEFLFKKIEEEDIDNIWFQPNEDRIISPRADVIYPLWRCDLTPFDYYLWGAVKYVCYSD